MIANFKIEDINMVYLVMGSLQLMLCLVSSCRMDKRPVDGLDDSMENQRSLVKEFMILRSKPSAFFSTLILSIFNGIGSAITTLIGNSFVNIAFMFMTTGA
jgi:hypothetical protein